MVEMVNFMLCESYPDKEVKTMLIVIQIIYDQHIVNKSA